VGEEGIGKTTLISSLLQPYSTTRSDIAKNCHNDSTFDGIVKNAEFTNSGCCVHCYESTHYGNLIDNTYAISEIRTFILEQHTKWLQLDRIHMTTKVTNKAIY
jgi:septin family protein